MTDTALSRLASSVADLREQLAAATNTNPREWFPVFKARYGMDVVFRVLCEMKANTNANAGEDAQAVAQHSVITQLFTCCTAVDPIVAAGDIPQYADISADTLSISAAGLEALAGRSEVNRHAVDAVMLQHTFGMIDDPPSLTLAQKVRELFPNAVLMEDCAHCVARMARSGSGEPVADISIHSFGVEKVLPTRFGGAVWVNPKLADRDNVFFEALTHALKSLPPLPKHIDRTAKAYINQNRVFSRLGKLGTFLRTSFQKHGWYEPPISANEQAGQLQYEPYAPSAWMNERAAAALAALDSNYALRRHNVEIYRQRLGALEDRGLLSIPRAARAGEAQPLLRFPFFVNTREASDAVIAAVRSAGVLAERWYRPELFPGVSDPRAYHAPEPGSPAAAAVETSRRVSECIVCLPTDLSDERIDSACAAVESILR